MPQPTVTYSLEEIQKNTLQDIAELERRIARNPRSSWPRSLLVLAREFQALAAEQPLDAIRIRDYTSRLRQHLIAHRLKGFEPSIWDAEALEHLAELDGKS